MDNNNDTAGLIAEARASLDGIAALLAAGENTLQIEPFQLLQLLQPARERLAKAEQELNKNTHPIVLVR